MSSVHSRPILIMAGGTGGHVFPALALARLLRARSYEVVWQFLRNWFEELSPIHSFSIAIPRMTDSQG